jgi:hypothetical protein
MKKILILLSLVLAGCAGAETAPLREDPNIQLAIAGAQLTGTAQAWSMQQVAWTVTAQSWTPTPSVTPSLTPSPTLTFTPTVDVTGTIAVEKMNAEVTRIRLETERKQNTNLFWAVFSPLTMVVGLVLLAYALITFSRERRKKFVSPNEAGEAPLSYDIVTRKMENPNINPNFSNQTEMKDILFNAFQVWLKEKYGVEPVHPPVNAQRQDEVTRRNQELRQKRSQSAAMQKLITSQAGAIEPNPVSENLFPLPAWELVNGWQGEKNLLPYGLTASGLGFVDVNLYPHWAALGMTGMGKSRRFLRPVIACALAAGHRVVIVGKMTDYGVFANHPNVNLVHVNQMTKPEHAERYGNILLALLAEMEKRDEYLMQVKRSTWAHSGRQNTFIVLDEVQNAIRMMKVAHSANAERVQMGIAGLVSEGRKVGFNIAIAGQRATGLADILSQTGKAIFRVEREEENAHKSLVGASQLNEGYFFARFGHGVKLAGAFEPTDEEIVRFLASRPAQPLERDWVDGRIVETFNAALPTPPAADALPEPNPRSDIEQLAEAYKDEYKPGMSGNAIGRMIGKPYGGSWKDKIDELREYLDRAVQGQNQNLKGVMQ